MAGRKKHKKGFRKTDFGTSFICENAEIKDGWPYSLYAASAGVSFFQMMQKLLLFLNTMRYICLGDRFLPELIFLLFLKKGAATGLQNLCGGFFIHKGEMLYTEKKFFGFQKFFRLYLPQ